MVLEVTVINKDKDDKETVDLVKDLKQHVQQLNHNNSALRTKLQFFKTLYETESKKKTPYMHIPPRVETGLTRKASQRQLTVSWIHQKNPSLPILSQGGEDHQVQQETITELQELTTKYRLKISLLDETVQRLESENDRLKENNETLQKNWDVDKVSLQHEIHDLKKKLVEQRGKFDVVDDQYRSLHKSYKEMLATTEALGKDLNSEREKNSELENSIQKERMEKQKTKDVLDAHLVEDHHR
jgi:chromosome segregation ATPase